jgi:hypothetical protein
VLLVAGAVVAGGLGAIAVWYFVLRDVAEPVRVGDVVTSYREDTDVTPGTSPVPEGVYVYATTGFEKTDALTGVTHRYPRRSTITVTKAPCGVQMRWDVLGGRSTTWTYCMGEEGWSIASQDERHTFFGRTERTTYLCADTQFRPAADEPGVRWSIECATDGAFERGRSWVVGRERLRVGGSDVSTVHLRKRSRFTGDIRGSASHDVWLARSSGVAVRILMVSRTTNDSAVGDVHYQEQVDLRLRSLAPRR